MSSSVGAEKRRIVARSIAGRVRSASASMRMALIDRSRAHHANGVNRCDSSVGRGLEAHGDLALALYDAGWDGISCIPEARRGAVRCVLGDAMAIDENREV